MKFAARGTILSLVDFAIVVGVDVIEPALHLKGGVWAAVLKRSHQRPKKRKQDLITFRSNIDHFLNRHLDLGQFLKR